MRDLIPADDTIRHIHLDRALLIGDKRNYGCLAAAGDLIAVWDDDDWSAPERLTQQIALMRSTGKSVVGFCSMRFEAEDGKAWLYRHSRTDYALGTSLMFRREWWQANPFPTKQVGEDFEFVHRARARGEITAVDAGDLMRATIHDANTSPRKLDGKNWTQIG